MADLRRRSSEVLDRRRLLRTLAQGAAAGLAGFGLIARRAAAEETTLQALIERKERDDLDPKLDSARRILPMPNASLPTLSPGTLQATERAIGRYEAILASGGWPVVPPVNRLGPGMRH